MKKYRVIRYLEPIEIEVEAENEDEADLKSWEEISLSDLETDSVSITEKHNVFVAETAKEREAKSRLIRCKDCKHRPTINGEYKNNGFSLEFPTSRCPCQCDDEYYNWMPDDDWYCANAERKEE